MKRIILVPEVIWNNWPHAAVDYGVRELCKQGWEPVPGTAGTPTIWRKGFIESTSHASVDLANQGLVALVYEAQEQGLSEAPATVEEHDEGTNE